MKYPKNQFNLLVKGLKVLNQCFENIKEVNPVSLQYLLHQQASEGQRHNAYFINKEGNIVKGYYAAALGLEGFYLLIDFLTDENFPLYPAGCNDTHIETAVKSALKLI